MPERDVPLIPECWQRNRSYREFREDRVKGFQGGKHAFVREMEMTQRAQC